VNQSVFVTVLLVGSLGIGYTMWYFAPHIVHEGGPLVSVAFALSIMLVSYIVERIITLRRARGTASIQSFFRKIVQMMQSGDLDGVLAACDKQQGSLANVIRSGVDRYSQVIKDPSMGGEKRLAETQRAIEEANALEIPLLERNLIALSTIASIATMIGLLGTTIGMIRAFAATGSSQGGVIDANALAQGISEALINTAGGLFNAIIGIVGYNFFVNKVDAFNYTIDEATYEVLQLIKSKESA